MRAFFCGGVGAKRLLVYTGETPAPSLRCGLNPCSASALMGASLGAAFVREGGQSRTIFTGESRVQVSEDVCHLGRNTRVFGPGPSSIGTPGPVSVTAGRAGKIDIGGDGSTGLTLGGNGKIYGKIAAGRLMALLFTGALPQTLVRCNAPPEHCYSAHELRPAIAHAHPLGLR